MRQLLEAGVHFGHQTARWNPKMKPFIFGERNGIYIINLQRTLRATKAALEFLREIGTSGGNVLFVGTKRQARDIVEQEARRCGMYYVNHRWLGGLLTNYETMRKSIARLKDLEAMEEDGRFGLLPKKEVLSLRREKFKLQRNLEGIKDMPGLPDALLVIDVRRERIAVDEAIKLGIPIVAVVDTNCDPEGIDFVIPGNDDAIRAIQLFTELAADAVLAGRQIQEKQVEEAVAETQQAVEPAAEQPEEQAASGEAEDATEDEDATEAEKDAVAAGAEKDAEDTESDKDAEDVEAKKDAEDAGAAEATEAKQDAEDGEAEEEAAASAEPEAEAVAADDEDFDDLEDDDEEALRSRRKKAREREAEEAKEKASRKKRRSS